MEIVFDEYVEIESFTSQFISSPPLKHKVEYSLHGKKLRLQIADTLRENTTYTFSFGNAIKDLNEGNPQSEFKYVFSTGGILDSQVVQGVLTDAFTNNPKSGIMVAMYAANTPDSIFMQEPPYYYGTTDESGHYTIENIAPGEYKIFGIQDADFNYIWSGAGEQLAFHNKVISSEENPTVNLEIFKSPAAYRFYRGKLQSFGKLQLFFSTDAIGLEIERLDTVDSKWVIEAPEKLDTLSLWTTSWKSGQEGVWQLTHPESGSIDTMRVRFFDKDTTRFKMGMLSKIPLSISDSVVVEASTPLIELDTTKMAVYKYDTVPVPFRTRISGARHLRLYVSANYGEKLTWITDSGAVGDLYGRYNDSAAYNIRYMKDIELSIFHFTVKADTASHRVLELFDDKGVVLYRESFEDEITVDLYDIHPEKYHARVIYDRNRNGRWDSGNYFESNQPEKVIYLDKVVELRANWEIDEIWKIP